MVFSIWGVLKGSWGVLDVWLAGPGPSSTYDSTAGRQEVPLVHEGSSSPPETSDLRCIVRLFGKPRPVIVFGILYSVFCYGIVQDGIVILKIHIYIYVYIYLFFGIAKDGIISTVSAGGSGKPVSCNSGLLSLKYGLV